MKVPYKKDNLHSSIDWERFFELQSGCNTKVEMIHGDKKGKVKTKVRPTRKGGRRKWLM